MNLSYADDTAIMADSLEELHKGFQIVEKWAKENKIQLNKLKSAVIKMKVDDRTPDPLLWDFHGIDLVESYKYLGM